MTAVTNENNGKGTRGRPLIGSRRLRTTWKQWGLWKSEEGTSEERGGNGQGYVDTISRGLRLQRLEVGPGFPETEVRSWQGEHQILTTGPEFSERGPGPLALQKRISTKAKNSTASKRLGGGAWASRQPQRPADSVFKFSCLICLRFRLVPGFGHQPEVHLSQVFASFWQSFFLLLW